MFGFDDPYPEEYLIIDEQEYLRIIQENEV